MRAQLQSGVEPDTNAGHHWACQYLPCPVERARVYRVEGYDYNSAKVAPSLRPRLVI